MGADMIDDIEVVIPVAGRGSRLGMELPKCLVPVLGKTIVEWQLQSLKECDVQVTLVVGYKANQVIEFVSSLDPSVQFIENPDFERTGTASSIRIAAEHVKSASFMSIDGDVLISPSSCLRVLKASTPVLGLTEQLTSGGVKVEVFKDHVISFATESESLLEWAGVFLTTTYAAQKFGEGHVYPELALSLPLPYVCIECHEVDTPSDLESAETWMSKMTTASGGQWKKK